MAMSQLAQSFQSLSVTVTKEPTSASYERTANHTLNRDTLLKNLVRDAHSDKVDLASEVNNSGGNVNLQCNSGFFLAVVKPAFSFFTAGFSKDVQGITISMPNPPTFTKDSTDLNETILYQFEISPEPTLSKKRASVHLHLTSRLIQVQGGARLPDSSTIAVWLSSHVLLPLLKDFANTAGVGKEAVDSINLSIRSSQSAKISNKNNKQIPTSNDKSCGTCGKTFDSRSKIIPCPGCGFFFHVTHLKGHPCSLPSSQNSGLLPPAQSEVLQVTSIAQQAGPHAHGDVYASLSSAQLSINHQASSAVTISTDNTTTVTSSVATRPSLLQSMLSDRSLNPPSTSPPQIDHTPVNISTHCPQTFTHTTSLAAPNQLQLNQEPRHVPVCLAPAVLAPRDLAPSRKKPKKGAPQVTPDGLQQELLGRELNVAQTKITSLDSQLSEMQKKNSILEARIRLFEDRENIAQFNTYFPQLSSQSGPQLPSPSCNSTTVSSSPCMTTSSNLASSTTPLLATSQALPYEPPTASASAPVPTLLPQDTPAEPDPSHAEAIPCPPGPACSCILNTNLILTEVSDLKSQLELIQTSLLQYFTDTAQHHQSDPEPVPVPDVEEDSTLPDPIPPTATHGPESPPKDMSDDIQDGSSENHSSGPTYGFDPFDPTFVQPDPDPAPAPSNLQDDKQDSSTTPNPVPLPDNPLGDDVIEEIPNPPATEEHQQFKPRRFLLPTPPPHMRINWVEGCACQQVGPPPRNQRKRRKRKTTRKKNTARTPHDQQPCEDLLIDLN